MYYQTKYNLCTEMLLTCLSGIQCADPGAVANADRFGLSYFYGDTIVYSCHEGFTRASGIIGPIQVYCGPDAQWHGADSCTGCTFVSYL